MSRLCFKTTHSFEVELRLKETMKSEDHDLQPREDKRRDEHSVLLAFFLLFQSTLFVVDRNEVFTTSHLTSHANSSHYAFVFYANIYGSLYTSGALDV